MLWKPIDESHYLQLRKNISILRQHAPPLNRSLGDLGPMAASIEISETDQGIQGVRSTTQPIELFPLDHGAALAAQQRVALENILLSGARMLIVSGLGAGHAAVECKRLLDRYPSAGFLIWEPNRACWAAFLALVDLESWPVQRSIYLFHEPEANDLVEAIRQHGFDLMPSDQTAYLLGTISTNEEYKRKYLQAAQRIAHRIQQLRAGSSETIEAFQSDMSRRLSTAPRSIWSCAHRDSYIHFPLAQSFLRGFEQLGFNTRLASYHDAFGANLTALGSLFHHRPDLLFSINLRPSCLLESLGLAKSTIGSLRRHQFCWLVDDTTLHQDPNFDSELSEFDWIFCIDRSYVPRVQAFTRRVAFLPPAAMFSEPGTPRVEYRSHLTYVGSLPAVPPNLRAMSSVCRTLIEKTADRKSRRYDLSFRDCLHELEPAAGQLAEINAQANAFHAATTKQFTDSTVVLEYFLYNCATFLKRKQYVEALLPLGLRVFGPESWLDILPLGYRDRYGGFLTSRDLADCYASATLCLNLHSHQCPTCLNPRDFDVPMAGSVVLGDWVADHDRGLLVPGRETLVFRDSEEALWIADYYLQNIGEWNEVREAGRRRVMRDHTYTRRARAVLDFLEPID